jgi:hypothetical protein
MPRALARRPGGTARLAGRVVEEDDAVLAARHFAAAGLLAHAPDEVAAVLVEIVGGHLDDQHFAVEGLGTVLRSRHRRR